MQWGPILRGTGLTVIGILFVGSLVGIVITGPIVVRGLDVPVETVVSLEHMRESVVTLCDRFSPRDYRHIENLDAAAGWIAERFDHAGFETTIDAYRLPEGVFRNVVAQRTGNDPTVGSIVIGAHYDAALDSPGADDNASGVAVLLEVARTLPATPLRHTLLLVAFGTGQRPFMGTAGMGSRVFATNLKNRGTEVELMLSLDGLGYFSDAPGSQRFPSPAYRFYYPSRGDFIGVVGDLKSGPSIAQVKRAILAIPELDVHSFRAPRGWGPLSDHLSFRREDFPGVLLTDTAALRYPHFHTALDTPDRLDFTRMAEIVQAIQKLLWESTEH